ncbi:MAG: SPOR domain-containing protein [Aliishimia sp.]
MAYQPYVGHDDASLYQDTYSDTSASAVNPLNKFTNIAGAIASVALVAGVGVWGYKLIVRDVTGIPIVRAVEGDMRIRPENPGGDLAQHQGLAVNEVAADGGASAPADRLILAPQPVRLTEEDMPLDEEAVAIVQQAIADQATDNEATEITNEIDTARIAAAAESGSVEDLVAVLTEGVTPLLEESAPIAGGPEVVVQTALSAPVSAFIDAPGVKVSVRPRLRPARLAVAAPQASIEAPAAVVPTARATIDPNNLTAGTRLVQLGAYDSIEVAQVEWAKFSARFSDLMVGKQQIVQEATSGGRTFFRLRAMGFADLSAARRFCSALVAEGSDCIPVVTR